MTLAHPAALLAARPQWRQAASNGLLLALWLWLYHPVFGYLATIFSREDFRANQIVLLGVLALLARQLRAGGLRPRLDAPPRLARLPLALALGGSAAFLVAERFLDVNTLSASLFGLAGYGLLGLWLDARRWWAGLPAALLLVGTLPFGDHLQTFVGYPMRLATAALVRDGLQAAGVASVGVDTILVFENGVSQVDLPCSGVKSLWTGALFLLAATWLERRPLDRRWLAVAVGFAALLFAVNVARVGVLVTVGEVAGWPLAAEMLHVPLGVLGFVAACAGAAWLLRQGEIGDWRLEIDGSVPPLPAFRSPLPAPAWLTPALALVILVMGLLYTPRPQTGLGAPPAWTFPAALATEPMALKPDERAWLVRDGAESADRRRFQWRGRSGSMILISSQTWRAHHRPERCFEVFGLQLDDSRAHLVRADFPLRAVTLGDDHGQLSAAYWFQSATRTTDDYGTRLWADLAPQRERWVLVSLLWDQPADPADPDVQALYLALHETVQRQLEGASGDVTSDE